MVDYQIVVFVGDFSNYNGYLLRLIFNFIKINKKYSRYKFCNIRIKNNLGL